MDRRNVLLSIVIVGGGLIGLAPSTNEARQQRITVDALTSFGELLKKKVEDARRPDIPDEIRERVRENVNWVVEQFNETINGVLKNEIQPVERA